MNPLFLSLLAVPSSVVNVTLSVAPRTIDINWTQPLYPNGVLVTYIVSVTGEFTYNTVTDEFYDSAVIEVNTTDNPMTRLTELEPNSNYTIGVGAVNSAGEGNITEVTVLTLDAG